MSWIQENKFAAIVIGATVVLSGALFYVGMDARSSAEELKIKGDSAISAANSLRNKKPYPDENNRALVKEKVAKFIDDSTAFQKSLLKYRPAKLPRPSSQGFSSSVGSHRSKLTAYFKDKGVKLPTKAQVSFGLERYRNSMAQSESTRYLDYQRKALEYMFKTLADAGPASLDNVYRTPIKEETSANKNNKNRKPVRGSRVTSVYRALPIEVQFTGDEKSLKDFIQNLSNSKEYFFITRSVRIKNLKQESPNIADGQFEAPAAAADFPDFEGDGDFEGGGIVDSSTSNNNEPILKKVLGDEKITVHLKIDLILFEEAKNVTFPGVARTKRSNNN